MTELNNGIQNGAQEVSKLMLKAVFWDMDGTLIDSEPYWHEGELKIAADHGGYWDEDLAWQGSGTPVPDVARRMVEHGCKLSIEEIGKGMIDYVAQKEFERIPWIDGVEDVLLSLKEAGVPSMLVTTSPRHLAENLIAQAPAGTFAGYVCGDDDVREEAVARTVSCGGPQAWHRARRHEVLHRGGGFHVRPALRGRIRCHHARPDRLHAHRQFQRPAIRLNQRLRRHHRRHARRLRT